MPPETRSVRVVIREVTYARLTTNILDQRVLEYPVAYGPGRPEIDPVRVLGPDFDPNSEEAQTAAANFKLGEQIDLLPDDYVRLMNGRAVVDAGTAEETQEQLEEEILDPATASVDDLARWIEQEKPTVQDVVNASGGEPDVARKLLEAESQANDQDARKGVVEGLTAVISRG
jgi:uncharacterized protein YlzI (FlbEa/FlbD family)